MELKLFHLNTVEVSLSKLRPCLHQLGQFYITMPGLYMHVFSFIFRKKKNPEIVVTDPTKGEA